MLIFNKIIIKNEMDAYQESRVGSSRGFENQAGIQIAKESIVDLKMEGTSVCFQKITVQISQRLLLEMRTLLAGWVMCFD